MMDAPHSFPEEERVEKEKVNLDQDPPYMEIMTMADGAQNTGTQENGPLTKWSSAQKVEPSYGLSLPLGEDYVKKKQKLQQELRQDYRRYMTEKNDMKTGVSSLPSQVLSLPIAERRSAKERLKSERNKEYNQFLQGQRQGRSEGLQVQNRGAEHHAVPLGHQDFPKLPPIYSAPTPRERPLSRRDASTVTETQHGRSRRRWADELDPVGRRSRNLRVYYDSEQDDSAEEFEFEERRRPRRGQEAEYTGRRGYLLYRRPEREVPGRRERKVYDPDDTEMDQYARRPRNDRGQRERRELEAPLNYKDDYRERNQRTMSAAPNSKLQSQEPTGPSERAKSVSTKSRAEFATGLMIGAANEDQPSQLRKERYRLELLEQMAEQQKNKRKEKELELRVAATGAIDPEKMPDRIKQFGAVSRDYDKKRRDIPYRPGRGLDALESQSERDPAGPEDGKPLERPRLAFQPPVQSYNSVAGTGAGALQGAVAPLNQEFHNRLSGALGEIIVPRIAGVPPPPAPTLADTYRTPYDEAYYYYGARNPLDPSLAYYGPAVGGLPPGAHTLYPHTGAQPQGSSLTGVGPSGPGGLLTDRPKQTQESTMSYQEALKKQMQEKQEQKKQEKEEKKRHEAQLEAERRMYNPWGKGGGGAPLRDSQGNLITDLNQMHKVNEEAYLNPSHRGKKARSLSRNMPAPVEEERTPSPHRISGFSYAQGPGIPMGSAGLPTPQQIHEQEKYREYLKRQIEEKRQKEAEEKEHLRLEEAREEKRLAEQRARIQKEYEEEQERRRCKEREQNAHNEEQIRLLRERRMKEEKKKREEEERENDILRKQSEREKTPLQETPRAPSPPIPAVQKRLGSQHKSRPRSDSQRSSSALSQNAQSEEQIREPTERRMKEEKKKYVTKKREKTQLQETPRAPSPPIPAVQKRLGSQHKSRPRSDSQRSSSALSHSPKSLQERSMSVPPSPPVPARKNQPRTTAEQPGVINKLSALRRQLHSEQQRLDRELQRTEREEPDSPVVTRRRERAPVDVFDMARLRVQAPVRRNSTSKAAEPINLQNIRDFNRLKYRDSESREEVRQEYPDPPVDDHSLELQQQALLREQQRRINRMKRREAADYFDLGPQPFHTHNFTKSSAENLPRGSKLESDSAFIDSSGDTFQVHKESKTELGSRDRPPSAFGRGTEAQRIKDDHAHASETPHPLPESAWRQDLRSLRSADSLSVGRLQDRNQQRMQRLEELGSQAWTEGDVSSDDGGIVPHKCTPLDSDRRYSVETLATEPWMRPGTSETLKLFMEGRGRRESHEWEGPSTYHG